MPIGIGLDGGDGRDRSRHQHPQSDRSASCLYVNGLASFQGRLRSMPSVAEALGVGFPARDPPGVVEVTTQDQRGLGDAPLGRGEPGGVGQIKAFQGKGPGRFCTGPWPVCSTHRGCNRPQGGLLRIGVSWSARRCRLAASEANNGAVH